MKLAGDSLKCLSEFANVRISAFSSLEVKHTFTANFAQNLTELMGEVVRTTKNQVMPDSGSGSSTSAFGDASTQKNAFQHAIFSNMVIYREILKILFRF